MNIMLKIATIVAGVLAALRPAVYGTLSIVFMDSSAIIDLLVFGSCIILVWHTFRSAPLLVWVAAFAVLLVAANIGFIHHFKDFGESGPLPFEWLNEYFIQALPLIILALLSRFLRGYKEELNTNKSAEPGA
jgi:hypothetical protein